MPGILLTAALATLALAHGTIASRAMAEEHGASAREFELESLDTREAAVVLRSIVGTRQLELLDGRRLRVTDVPENLEAAGRVLQMIESPSPSEDGFESYAVPSGGSVIASIVLGTVGAPEAMTALRILRISRVAVARTDALMILRDTPEQIDAAWKLIQVMERMCPKADCVCDK